MFDYSFALSGNYAAAQISDELTEHLPKRYRLEPDGSPEPVSIRLYDTFDWRLFKAGYLLEETVSSAHRTLLLKRLDDGAPSAAQSTDSPLGFTEDLPAGKLRDALSPIVEMRRLLPSGAMDGESMRLSMLNKDDKTVARLRIDSLPTGQEDVQGIRLHISEVKGYRRQLALLLKAVKTLPVSQPSQAAAVIHLFSAVGRTPADYSSKLSLSVTPDMTGKEALCHILVHLSEQMTLNLDGTRDNVDTEFLHDFRIAVRRSRSAVGQFKKLFPATELARFTDELRWLGRVTGPCRDADVYLLAFDDYSSMLPKERRAALLPLKRFLETRQRREHTRLKRALSSKRYVRFADDWAAFLTDDGVIWPDRAERPIQELAGQRIWKLYRAIIRDGGAVTQSTPDVVLHELRKEGKKLRYLFQFFEQIYPKSNTRKLAKPLRNLQNILGDFQDYHVQSEALTGFAQEMSERKSTPPETLMAMGLLVEVLGQLQTDARKRFAEAFDHFASEEVENRFRTLCGKKRKDMA